MGSPSVLEGLRKCIEYLKTMPEEEARRIADDYRVFSEKYDSEEESFEEALSLDIQVALPYEVGRASGVDGINGGSLMLHTASETYDKVTSFAETLAA